MEWISPDLAPRPPSFLYPFARSAREGLNTPVFPTRPSTPSRQSSHLMNSYSPELGMLRKCLMNGR